MLRTEIGRSAARLAVVRPPVPRRPALLAALRMRGLGHLPVKVEQQLVEPGIAHKALDRVLHVLAPSW